MAGVIIGISLNLILFIGFFVFFKRRIDRALSTEEIVDRLRSEVNGLVVELNQTSERNIGIIEERIQRLQSLVSRADRRIQMLNRETEKNEISAELYEKLKKNASSKQPPSVIDENDESEPPQQKIHTDAGVGDLEAPTRSSGQDGLDSVEGLATESLDPEPADTIEAVMELHRQGFEPKLIASKLRTSLGEVELIISLGGQARMNGP